MKNTQKTKKVTYTTETLKFRAGSLGGLAHQEVQFKAPEGSNEGSPYVKTDCWDENAVKNVSRLIAAAPDLLAALNEVLGDLCDFQEAYPDLSDQFDGTFAKINAALAKVEGDK